MNNINQNKGLNQEEWAVVGYNDNTGIGSMVREIKNVLGLGKHIIINSQRLENAVCNSKDHININENTSIRKLKHDLAKIKGIIFIEKPHWNKNLLHAAKALNIKLICIPMWEWFKPLDSSWNQVDLFICPNQKALNVVKSYGYENSILLNWTLDLGRLPKRKITGKAKIFFHNAGIVDHDDRKGTIPTLKAFHRIKDKSLRLIVRKQNHCELPEIKDSRIEIHTGNYEFKELYNSGDVAIQPSKMEGLGFMVLEPVCSGIPTITTDIEPIKNYVANPLLRVKRKLFKRSCFPKIVGGVKHAHMYEPAIRDITKKIMWCTQNDLQLISEQNKLWANEQFDKNKIIKDWSDVMIKLLK